VTTRLLVTGTGRCGSKWMSRAITSAGTPCTHEVFWNYDRHGEGDWQAEVAWPAAPFTPIPHTYVVHLVRHPLDTIRSRASWGTFDGDRADRRRRAFLGRWAMEVVPAIAAGRTTVERAAIHWVEWNKLVKKADEVLRLEDVTAGDITRLAQIVTPEAELLDFVPRANSSEQLVNPITWDDVAHVPGLLELAAEYGYKP
jgi:hypothetical protein